MNQLSLIKSEIFGEVKCDFWRGKKSDILMTREQIGQALGYADPNKAIDNIHQRHKDRLDKFSTTLSLMVVEGGREVTREVVVYTSKGLYEICRYSRQPKADAFMDWAWDVIESIRKTGSYSSKGSFPWLDSLNKALRPDTKIRRDLHTKPERLRARAGLLRQAQDETGHDYGFLIDILETSANNQEQKILHIEAVKQARADREESRSINGQAQRSLDWLRTEYAAKGQELAYEQEDYLCVRYDLWKAWAIKNKMDFPAVLRELHRVGLVKRHQEGRQHRYGRKGRRSNGKQAVVVSLKKSALDGGPGMLRLIK